MAPSRRRQVDSLALVEAIHIRNKLRATSRDQLVGNGRCEMNSIARSFGAAFAGALLGSLAILLLVLSAGLMPLLSFPPFDFLIGGAALIATFVVSVLSRLSRRRHLARSIMIASALLTILIFAAPLVYWGYDNHGAGGPLFG